MSPDDQTALAVGLESSACSVSEVMIRRPTTLPEHATVADVRAVLADDHVHMALLMRGDLVVGTVTRSDLDDAVGPDGRALAVATLEGRTVPPEATVQSAHSRMIDTAQRRLVVVDHDHRLLGLLCLKRTGTGFCSDEDVASRQRAGTEPASSVMPVRSGSSFVIGSSTAPP